MKNFKQDIIKKMVEKTASDRIISLRETAAELGYSHIARGDVQDILNALRKVDGYRPVQIMNGKNDSLFCSLCLVENGTEFENEEDEEDA